jgi:hypothetical protein
MKSAIDLQGADTNTSMSHATVRLLKTEKSDTVNAIVERRLTKVAKQLKKHLGIQYI